MIGLFIYILLATITGALVFWIQVDKLSNDFELVDAMLLGTIGLLWFLFLPLIAVGVGSKLLANKAIKEINKYNDREEDRRK